MPLNQDIEQGHGEAYFGFKILPNLMAHMLEVTDVGQHRKYGLNQHTPIPLTALTQTQIGGVPIHLVEGGVRKGDHLVRHVVHQPLEGAAVINVSRVTRPANDQAEVIDQITQLATYDPTMVGFTLFADLFGTASLPNRMQPRGTGRTATRCHSRQSLQSAKDQPGSGQCSVDAS
jgi:hypothetical protein